MNQKTEGQIRHILSLVSGVLVFLGLDDGLLDSAQEVIMVVIGAIMAVIAFVRSYISKGGDEEAPVTEN